MVGRAMTDLERRFAVFEGPALEDGQAILTGRAPVSALDGYQTEVTAYTGGLGKMICTLVPESSPIAAARVSSPTGPP